VDEGNLAVRQLKLLAVIAAAVAATCGGYALWHRGHAPSCLWPLRVRGAATGEQVGLAECYLGALAVEDKTELKALAQYRPSATITSADLVHSGDVRSGVATATFTPSPVDPTFVMVDIDYADGKRDRAGMINMVSMGEPAGWRMVIGQ
jgi:hypothetical protein